MAMATSTSTANLTKAAKCLENRHWYAFLCSSFITFFVFLVLVLAWRIFAWLCCHRKSQAAKQQGKTGEHGSPHRGALSKSPDPEIGWMTEAKDWAGELISGQTSTGRILVSPSRHPPIVAARRGQTCHDSMTDDRCVIYPRICSVQ